MAAPITHIVLTSKIYDTYFADKDKAKFYAGTSFPDIRHLAKVPRELTHLNDSSIYDISSSESFSAGLKFHEYLDNKRLAFIEEAGLSEKLPNSRFIVTALKYIEDEYLYDKITNWGKYIDYLKIIYPEELDFGIPSETVKAWHDALIYLFSQKPTEYAIEYYINMLKEPREIALAVIAEIKEVKKIPAVAEYINQFYEKFELLVAE